MARIEDKLNNFYEYWESNIDSIIGQTYLLIKAQKNIEHNMPKRLYNMALNVRNSVLNKKNPVPYIKRELSVIENHSYLESLPNKEKRDYILLAKRMKKALELLKN